MSNAWRRVVISEHADLRKKDDCLLVNKDGALHSISIEQISALIIESQQVTFSSSLMTYLTEKGVSVIFCDEKHHPYYEVVPYHRNEFFPKRLMAQTSWEIARKKTVWRHIVTMKIRNQAELLARTGSESSALLRKMAGNVDMQDPEETESQAARIYFRSLFGYPFNRRTDNDTNAALNYGYSILLSSANRIIAAHGYSTSVGINHHSGRNPFNLSCDIMEPFRPFADEIVYQGSGRFDFSMRKKLISVMTQDVVYNDNRMSLETALEEFTLDVIRSVDSDEMHVGGIGFVS